MDRGASSQAPPIKSTYCIVGMPMDWFAFFRYRASMNPWSIPTLSVLLLSMACSEAKDSTEKLPIAHSWKGELAPGNGNLGKPGMPLDSHAGLETGTDPHAGLDMSGQEAMGSVAGLGLQAPDPSRSIDSSKFLEGQIRLDEGLSGSVPEGAVLFLSVRPIHAATGESLGSPLAVEILELTEFPIPFHLSGAQSMVAGTEFSGDVLVYGRIDGDREATTSSSGDIEGSLQATIPARGLVLELNSIVR